MSPKKRIKKTVKASAKIKGYASDLAYLQDELEWVEQRCRRMKAESKLKEFEQDEPRERRRTPMTLLMVALIVLAVVLGVGLTVFRHSLP